MLKPLIGLLLFGLSPAGLAQESPTPLPDKSGDYLGGIYHVGMWVENLDEMLTFLSEFSELEVISRVPRPSGGERLFLSDPRGQRLELLSDPSAVKPHERFPLHPQGTWAGMAHISIEVDDAAGLKDVLGQKGYEIIRQVPADFADGYATSEVAAHRILFIEGPSSVTFEFFEIRD